MIESLRYLYVLFMNNELLKQHFKITQLTRIVNITKRKNSYNSHINNNLSIKQSVNRGK